MFVYGIRSSSTCHGPYPFNKQLKLVSETAVLMSDHYQKHFPAATKAISLINKGKPRIKGMEDCMVSEIVSAKNQVNAAHIDCQDRSVSLSTWVEDHPGTAKGWAFILPNVTRDSAKAIAIKLKHGLSIEWDGRLIHHCSTLLEKGERNNVYGYYHGAK
mmetsp:Transcript_17622/g.24509  ORF Transcript_17622/g.24509 Transcript_17622/m.24509 type:complete len:159 (-) Transcript_17622:72-548(-)